MPRPAPLAAAVLACALLASPAAAAPEAPTAQPAVVEIAPGPAPASTDAQAGTRADAAAVPSALADPGRPMALARTGFSTLGAVAAGGALLAAGAGLLLLRRYMRGSDQVR